jgi:hypothetical protein
MSRHCGWDGEVRKLKRTAEGDERVVSTERHVKIGIRLCTTFLDTYFDTNRSNCLTWFAEDSASHQSISLVSTLPN